METPFKLIRYILLLTMLLLLGGGAFLYLAKSTETVEAFGYVEPAMLVDVSPEVSGLVKQVLVAEGEQVERGQILLVIDDTVLLAERERLQLTVDRLEEELSQQKGELDRLVNVHKERQLQKARTAIEQASARLRHAEEELEDAKELHENKWLSLDEFRLKELEHRIAKTDYEAAQSELSLLKGQLSDEEDRRRSELYCKERDLEHSISLLSDLERQIRETRVPAPVAGTILTKDVARLTGKNLKEGEPVLQLADLSALEFSAQVSQKDQHRVAVGQSVYVFIDAFPNRAYKVFEGQVLRISPQPMATAVGPGYEVVVNIREPWVREDGGPPIFLKPGLSGRAEIILRENVPLLQLLFGGATKGLSQ